METAFARTLPIHVLVVEDDPDARANIRDILELDEVRVDEAGTAAAALDRTAADWSSISAVILDRRLPDADFDDLLAELRRQAPDAELIVVTGHADLGGAIEALRGGASDYILKPLDPDALRASLERSLQRRTLRLAKRRSEAAFRGLVEAAEAMIIIVRPDRTIAYFSPFAERLTGYRAAELRGQDFCERLVPADRPDTLCEAFRRLEAGEPVRGVEGEIRCRDGSLRQVVWNASLLEDDEGGKALLGVGHDITELKRAQERALQSERLAAIGQMVTGLAHESRNALQRGQSCLELLALHVEDRPAALDLIRRAQEAQDHLRHLFEDVRNYAAPIRLERGRYELPSVWREAWLYVEPARRGRRAELIEERCEDETSCWLDPFRLVQVFRNIMENALAACPDPVELRIRCEPDRIDGRPALRVSVRDNGPGFTAEQAARIFEPFFTTKARGTGLGMAISRRIVEAHAGRIAVGPPGVGAGAEIVLTLPREPL